MRRANQTLIYVLTMLPVILLADSIGGYNDPLPRMHPVSDDDFYSAAKYPEAQIELGRALFFDKVLSGNRNISCASCHHPSLGTSDGIALGIGEGASGLGHNRHIDSDSPIAERVPRNSPALFFLGAREFEVMFHDGRVSTDPNKNWDSGFWTPAREQLPAGLDNVLAAQAMFPVTSAVEMAGQKGENPVATAAALDELGGESGVWDQLANRLRDIPEYVDLFNAAYSHIEKADDISFVDAANAIAAYETVTYRADNSPFDNYLRNRDANQLDRAERNGMALFYGEAGCSGCHKGKFQSDHEFHAIGMPQTGPGKNDGYDYSYWHNTGFMARLEDQGRGRETLKKEDLYAFRTPTLRNVELTAPYGHSGAFKTLEEVVRHHVDPLASLQSFDVASIDLPEIAHVAETTVTGSELIIKPVNPGRLGDFHKRDTWVMSTPALKDAIARANALDARSLSDTEIDELVAFLKALTDPVFRNANNLVPDRVPSGLEVDK